MFSYSYIKNSLLLKYYEYVREKKNAICVYIYSYYISSKNDFYSSLIPSSIFPHVYNTNAIRDIYHLYAKAVLFFINTECLA